MSFTIDITGETMPTFDDRPVNVCWIDGQAFNDPGVYQMHMLMYHGLNVDVKADDNTIIKAPVNPVIPPPDPYFIPAPGVTLVPVAGGNFTPVYNPGITGSQLDNTKPLTVIPSKGTGGTGGAGWALAGIIGAIVAFGWTRTRRTRKARK